MKQILADRIDRICSQHGCEITPTASGVPAIRLLPRNQGGGRDSERLAAFRRALESAGISTDGWLS